MYRLSILMLAAVAVTACSNKNSDTSNNPDIAPTDSVERVFDFINVKSTADSTFIEDLTWNENNTSLNYRRLSRHIPTADSLVYLDIVCDYIPGNQNLTTYVARTIDESTLTVRGLEKSNFPTSIYAGEDAVENTIEAIARDFKNRFYPELQADTLVTFMAQNGVVNQLIHFVTPQVLTYGNYNEYYVAGAAHGMSNFELTTFNRTTEQPLSFAQLVKSDEVNDVREELVETMAKTDGYDDEDKYLEQLTQWISPTNGASTLTPETLPIYNAGLTRDGLTIVYPLYSIGPFVRGISVFTLPYDKVEDDLVYGK